ncbi:MAG: hypothetical protein HYV40_06460 [Candidatus Levybacteria bacterium]|nr:hypothetical protein [Candidatus Levybacteria bacterium]
MVDPKTKEVLLLLATGTVLVASLLMPNAAMLLKPLLEEKKRQDQKEWAKYNQWRLKQVLRRMHKQKLVEIVEEGGLPIVKIAEKGRKKILRYKLEDMQLDQKRWDGKWRIVIYDIYSRKQQERKFFHLMLKQLRFYQLQRSVYLTPYPCRDEIEYIRQLSGLGSEVHVLTVDGLEDEQAYRSFFGL